MTQEFVGQVRPIRIRIGQIAQFIAAPVRVAMRRFSGSLLIEIVEIVGIVRAVEDRFTPSAVKKQRVEKG